MPNLPDDVPDGAYPQLDLDRQLCFSLYAVSRAITTGYGRLLGEVGLTYPQYLAMLALWGAKSLTVSDLGTQLRLDSGTLSPLLKRLEAAGLVVRERDTADERRVFIRPTADGWQLRERVAHVPAAIGAAMGLDTEAYLDLKNRLARVLTSLDMALDQPVTTPLPVVAVARPVDGQAGRPLLSS